MSERKTSNGARKIPGTFSKFCEPLKKIRARFSYKKILPKKAHWAATEERTFLEAAPTCDFLAFVEADAGQLRAISQRLDVACVE